jgi:hypothetical protein
MQQVSGSQQIPITIVGGSSYGRYNKISLEKTYNMFISDGWLVNYPGYKKILDLLPGGVGRGVFSSVRGRFAIAVISSAVFRINLDFSTVFLGTIQTSNGIVSIDENLARQICIVDGSFAYIYNYETGTFTQQTLTFQPSYVSYHNTFFLFGSSSTSDNPQNWYTFVPDTTSTIKLNTEHALQTKPDTAVAIKRLPGKGNNVIVFGNTVCEIWTNVGGKENYRRVSSSNIDNGTVSASTIAANEDTVCWLARNENNSAFIMVSDGSGTKRISTDGLDYELSILKNPERSTAFFYRQDGHLFYQITFYDPRDNLTLVYDFSTQMFFNVSDENLHYYPAAQNVFFDNSIYFVSLKDSGFYQMDTNYITYDYDTNSTTDGVEIPRIRICNTVRMPDSARFRCGQFTFWLEQGNLASFANIPSRVDMSISKDGNQTFGTVVSKELNPQGKRRNQIRWWRMGQANEMTIQLRFYGLQRFVCNNGTLEVY